MTYKALENIGEYKKGELIPDEKGIVWAKMYDVSPVEKVGSDLDKSTSSGTSKELAEEKKNDKKKDEKKSSSDFQADLTSINGIGAKTVEDIIKMYPTEESLKKAISQKKSLPFRDDIEDKLKKHFL